jgi:hypothetical protein
VEDEPPSAKMYQVIGNKSGCKTWRLLYQAVPHAKTAGTARHWKFVDVVQNEEKSEVTV